MDDFKLLKNFHDFKDEYPGHSMYDDLDKDGKFMLIALQYSLKGRNTTAPNPWVGCVIVKDDKIIGIGYHKKAGESHAEVNAILEAENSGYNVEGATAYVTLEPCSHYGRTPPCSELLVNKKISTVVIGYIDPDNLVNSKGIKYLKENNVIVKTNVLNDIIKDSLRPYTYHRKYNKSYMVAKIALSNNNCYSDYTNNRLLITGEESNKHVHNLRKSFQAIMVGSDTFIYDKPKLNVRDGHKVLLEYDPYRIILLPINIDTVDKLNNIVKKDIYCTKKTYYVVSNNNKNLFVDNIKYNLIYARNYNNKYIISDIQTYLADLGILCCLVEGGAKLIQSMILQGCIEELFVYKNLSMQINNGINFYENINCNINNIVDLDFISNDNLSRSEYVSRYYLNYKNIITKMNLIINDIQSGKPVIVMDAEDRENEADLFIPASKMTPSICNDFIRYGTGIICVTMTEMRALELDLPLMVQDNKDINQTNFTVTCDSVKCKTGVSATERSDTINILADISTKRSDISRPGHINGLVAQYGNLDVRQGHTEASVTLCRMAGVDQIGAIVELMNKDGTMMDYEDSVDFAKRKNYNIVTIDEMKTYLSLTNLNYDILSSAEIYLKSNKKWKMLCVSNNSKDRPDIVLVYGDIYKSNNTDNISEESVLTRIHSECYTGDILGSLMCDCGDQLSMSISMIEENKSGLIILPAYHEGRGIGLIDKIKSYRIQDIYKYDTFKANTYLGYKEDGRNYENVSRILDILHIKNIILLSNNKYKINNLEKYITETKSFKGDTNTHNHKYMQDKQIYYSDTNSNTDNISNSSSNSDNNYFNMFMNNINMDNNTLKELLKDKKILILSTTWHKDNLQNIIDDILDVFKYYDKLDISVSYVPGSFEFLSYISNNRDYDLVICTGILLKGKTDHYENISNAVTYGLANIALDKDYPMLINGVLNLINVDQINEKCEKKSGTGLSLAVSAIEMIKHL